VIFYAQYSQLVEGRARVPAGRRWKPAMAATTSSTTQFDYFSCWQAQKIIWRNRMSRTQSYFCVTAGSLVTPVLQRAGHGGWLSSPSRGISSGRLLSSDLLCTRQAVMSAFRMRFWLLWTSVWPKFCLCDPEVWGCAEAIRCCFLMRPVLFTAFCYFDSTRIIFWSLYLF